MTIYNSYDPEDFYVLSNSNKTKDFKITKFWFTGDCKFDYTADTGKVEGSEFKKMMVVRGEEDYKNELVMVSGDKLRIYKYDLTPFATLDFECLGINYLPPRTVDGIT